MTDDDDGGRGAGERLCFRSVRRKRTEEEVDGTCVAYEDDDDEDDKEPGSL
jgi:hypothetical protein